MADQTGIEEQNHLMGIDLGTSSVKVGLLNLVSGEMEHIVSRSYDEYSEYDPTAFWERALAAISESVKGLERGGVITAVGVTGQMHGAVLYNQSGGIVGSLINWRDKRRSSPEMIERMNQAAGPESALSLGTRMAPGFTGSILAWLQLNEPQTFRDIHHFCLFPDFIRGKLTGERFPSTDQTNAFGTGLFNTRLNQWHTGVIEVLGLPTGIFPRVHGSSEIAGEISAEIAASIGLRSGIPVIYGGGDNQMSMFGSGLTSPQSPALVNIGTAAQVSMVSAAYLARPGIDTRPFFDGQFALVGVSLGGGGHYQELRDQVHAAQPEIDYAEMDELAAGVPAGADGLLYCTGPSRISPARRQGFFGNIEKQSSVGHRTRAVMEGILMDLHESFSLMEQDAQKKLLIGAGKALQTSRTWARITADLFGKQLKITNSENGILGAALRAGIGVGRFGRPQDWEPFIRHEAPIMPDTSNTRFYRDHFIGDWKRRTS